MAKDTDITKQPAVDYKPLPLGTSAKPWPTILRGDANGVRTFALGLHQSDSKPLWVPSIRPYHEVMPELYRDMPVQGMLEAFEKILKNKLVYVESDPGFGKTFLAEYVGRAMHPKGAVIADAGGKNLESLLFETVFDPNDSNDLVDRINHALADGTMTEPSLKALRELKTAQGGQDNQPLLKEEEDGTKHFDWKGLEESGIARSEIDSVLASVQKYQEWNGGLRIGFKDVPGKLIRAAIEHRPLVIDEFARRKLGTEAVLQRVWEVINGQKKEMTITLGNLGEFTLHSGDIPKVIITSNTPKDGPDVHGLSDSLKSRFSKVKVPGFSEEDWTHRINQKLTGLPINTLARLEKGKMDGDGKWQVNNHPLFTKNMHAIHKGNNPAVSPLQSTLIDHWQAVMSASAGLAQGFHKSEELLNPESKLLQDNKMAAVRFEVDKPGDKVEKVTPRAMLDLLEDALNHMAEAVPATETKGANFSNWDMPDLRPSDEPIEAHLGDRIKALVEKWIDDVAEVNADGAGRPKLYEHLKRVWTEAGVLGPNSVLDGLNIKSKKVDVASDDAVQMQGAINALLKKKYPDAEGITAQQAEVFLANFQEEGLVRQDGNHFLTSVASVDTDGIANNELTVPANVTTRPLKDNHKTGFDELKDRHPVSELIAQDTVIATLAMPHVGTELLVALGARPEGAADMEGISYNKNYNCMVTTVLAEAEGKLVKMHVLHAPKTGKTLVISVSPSSLKLPSNSNVTLVPALEKDSPADIERWLKENEVNEPVLREAFEVRNAVPKDMQKKSFAEWLTNPKVATFSPTVVDRRTELSQHAEIPVYDPADTNDKPSNIVHQGTVAKKPNTNVRIS